MDATAWVAVAGIVGTLLGPLVLERMRRESTRREHLTRLRAEVYADLLLITAIVADNAVTWSAVPRAELTETPDEELNRVMARVRTLGSDRIYPLVELFTNTAHEFNRRLFRSRLEHERADRAQVHEDQQTMVARMSTGEIADELRRQYKPLLDEVRAEVAK